MAIRSTFNYDLAVKFCTVQNAILTETKFYSESKTYDGAVYDSDGALVIDSVRPGEMVSYRPVTSVSLDRSILTLPPYSPEAIYGGHFFYAWGHFLIETLSTAVQANELPDCPVIFSPWFVTEKNEWAEKFEAHVMPLLRAAGWANRQIIISSNPMHFGSLHIPQRLTTFGIRKGTRTVHESVTQVFDRIRSRFGDQRKSGHVVVVMRSPNHRNWHASEQAVYDALARVGFEVVLPEAMTAEVQVAMISRAETLLGFSGSALHNSVFMVPGGLVIEIGDNPSWNASSPIQDDLCYITEQKHRFVCGFNDARAPRSAEDLMMDVFAEYRAVASSAELTPNGVK